MKCLIVHNTDWSNFDKRVNELSAEINRQAPWLKITIDTKKFDYGKVEYMRDGANKLVSEPWFDRVITDRNYKLTCLLLDRKQANKAKISSRVKGCHFNDGDTFNEIYVVSDERTVMSQNINGKRAPFKRFEAVFIHELQHALYENFNKKDNVHIYENSGNKDKIWKELASYAISNPVGITFKSEYGLLPNVHYASIAHRDMCEAAGIPIRITQGLRSMEDQSALYAKGRTTAGGIVTNAKAGESFHNYGVAYDIYPTKHGWDAPASVWNKIAKIGKDLGFEWGGDWEGDFKDKPHFEMTLGYSIKDFQTGKVDYTKYGNK